MKKWFVVLLLLLTVINISALVTLIAQRWKCGKTESTCVRSPESCGMILHQALHFTDEQKREWGRQQAAYRLQTDTLAQALYNSRIELSQCLLTNPVDASRLEKITLRMDSLQSRMQRQVVHHLLAQKKYLSPQQQEILFSMILKQCTVADKSCCPK